MTRRPVTPEDVDLTAELAVAALSAGLDADWSVPAGGLDWSCRRTLEHTADDLVLYAALVTSRAQRQYPPMLVALEESATPAGYLSVLESTARLLSAVLRMTPADVEVWHPAGFADPEAVAAMGVVELLVHTHDIGQGLGLGWQPPPGLSARVLGRLFPRVSPEPETSPDGVGPPADWTTLLWATGRIATPTRARQASWRWHNERDPQFH